MKNILLIGGSGYIGTVLTEKLLHEQYNVVNIDMLIYNNESANNKFIDHPNYKFINNNIVDKEELKSSINADAVVVLAGLVGDPITKKYPKESALINDIGIKNVIDICAFIDIEKFIFISTCSNYGLIKDSQLATEDFELNPLSLYAKSKVGAEKYIMSLKGKTDMNPTILRFATAFGLSPRMRFDLTISEFTRELVLGNELLIYDAKTWRPYCHVQDFANLIQKVIESPKEKVSWEVFNAGGDINNATKQMIVDKILEKIPNGKVNNKEFGSDPRNYKVDFKKVKSVLGFEPEFTIQDGIDELINKINNNEFHDVDKNRNFFGNYEINYRISK